MIDPVLILAPIAALPLVGLLRFVGCAPFSGTDSPVATVVFAVADPSDAITGQPYSYTLTATGGATPYVFAEQAAPADPWPAWLILTSSGALSGTPPAPAIKVPLDILVTDSTNTTQKLTIHLTVDPAPLTITNTSLPSGQLNTAYPATQLNFTGGMPPVTWSAAGLPAGLTVSATGQIAGTPTKSGADPVTVTAVDTKPSVTTKALTIDVTAPFALFNSGVDPTGKVLADGSIDPHFTLTASADLAFPGPNAIVATSAPPAAVPSGWVQGTASKWIAPQQNALNNNAVGDYKYQTTFDLTGFDPTTASITGTMWSDNAAYYTLNGHPEQPIAQAPATFVIPIGGGFIAGKNTLVFRVNNAGTTPNPTGMRVELAGQAVSTV